MAMDSNAAKNVFVRILLVHPCQTVRLSLFASLVHLSCPKKTKQFSGSRLELDVFCFSQIDRSKTPLLSLAPVGAPIDSATMAASIEQASADIQRFNKMNRDLGRESKKLGTGRDSEQLRNQLRQDVHELTSLSKSILSILQQLKRNAQGGNRAQINRLSRQFEGELKQFEATERHIKQQERAELQFMRKHSSVQDPSVLDVEDQFASAQQQSVSLQIREYDVEEIRRKQQDIEQIERDVQEIGSMMEDLNYLVNEQGEMVDSIEANMGKSRDHAVAAHGEIQQAAKYQAKRRKLMCVIFFIFIVILTIVLVVVIPKDK
jgi:t-SNARE complex subunit (syntaxin)